MKPELEIIKTTVVHTLPGIWDTATLRALFEIIELEDLDEVEESDYFDIALMALQDLEHQRAGEAVLEAVFGSSMSPGQRQNFVDDLQDDEAWQDFSVVSQQAGIFTAVVIMHQAFPNRYPMPDALQVHFAVVGTDPNRISSTELVRSLGAAMAPSDVMRRLYEDELSGGAFEDAEHIIWHRNVSAPDELTIITARQWLGSLVRGDRFPYLQGK